jgi:hypothetical protein
MRVLAFALLTVLLPAAASAGTDIAATCSKLALTARIRIQNIKPALPVRPTKPINS